MPSCHRRLCTGHPTTVRVADRHDREEIIIMRAGHEPAVVVALDEYQSLRETAYLMRSPANACRLLEAIERLEAGDGVAHDLVEAD